IHCGTDVFPDGGSYKPRAAHAVSGEFDCRLLRARLLVRLMRDVNMALAYFITFSTYGTHLHGSAKGSVDDEHSVHGTSFLEADETRETQARDAMAQPPYAMSAKEREIVCKAIVDL